MSDRPSVKELVVDEALEQVDLESALNGGPLRDEIDATEIGSAVGRQVGEQLGRSMGEELGASIQETASTSLEEGRSFRAFIGDLVRAIREALVVWLEDLGLDGIASGVAPTVEETADDGETDADEADADETTEETGDETEEADEDGDEETEEADDEAAEDENEAVEEDESEPNVDDNGVPDIDDLEDLRRDALEDVLEMVSYRDLQSIAKEVGVKANLEGSEMRDRIVDAVTDESETSEEAA
ncbi:hypothetical protein [Natronosalvus vescus]|uniref:hypothetical protein n=1 Tax=Natronosalvus vescus TaxID=2953881 RepID=UPI002091CBA3|nr:hypothetical protein [Natronosalvus vescus]